jgi:hypothetical protein
LLIGGAVGGPCGSEVAVDGVPDGAVSVTGAAEVVFGVCAAAFEPAGAGTCSHAAIAITSHRIRTTTHES